MYGRISLPAHLGTLSGRIQLRMLPVQDLYFQDKLSHLNEILETSTTMLHCPVYVCFDYCKKQVVSDHGEKIPVLIYTIILIVK